jgi:hypothetical protein
MGDTIRPACLRCGRPNLDAPEYLNCADCRSLWDHRPPPPPEVPRVRSDVRPGVRWLEEKAQRIATLAKLRCLHCGAKLDAQRVTRQFCDVRCRVAHFRASAATK